MEFEIEPVDMSLGKERRNVSATGLGVSGGMMEDGKGQRGR